MISMTNISISNKLADLSSLLEETLQSYYWIGFILADGNLSPKYRLKITLAKKDFCQVEAFAKFVNFKGTIKFFKSKTPSAELAAMDVTNGRKIREKFDISSNKTISPPSLDFYTKMSDEFFVSLLVGLIDGDGHVKLRTNTVPILTIKIHKSWFSFLVLITKRLGEIIGCDLPSPKITNDGYALFSSSNSKVTYFLKNFILENNLQVLERKWVFETRPTRMTIANERRELIKEQVDNGITSTAQISKVLGLRECTVYRALFLSANPIIKK